MFAMSAPQSEQDDRITPALTQNQVQQSSMDEHASLVICWCVLYVALWEEWARQFGRAEQAHPRIC